MRRRLPLLRASAAVLILVCATACSRVPGLRHADDSHQRVAVLPIDNLSGDPSLDWVAGATPRIVAEELSGTASTVPLLVPSVNDAYLNGATRLLHGYVDRRGEAAGLHFEFTIEDAASHKMQPVVLDGAPLEALGRLAHQIDPSSHAFSSTNPQAVEAFGRDDYARAVELDPNFSAAWLGWAQSLSAKDPEQAAQVAARALAQPSLRSAADRARIELVAANLRHDPQGELKALESLASQSPPDPGTLKTLAEAAMNARQFGDAARHYEELIKLDASRAPSGSDRAQADSEESFAMNLLGYAYAFAGDLPAALKALDQYRRQPGQEANALDSLGEAYFVNGKFSDAEKYFVQAHEKNAALLGGGDLLKAAYAHWLGSKGCGDAQPAGDSSAHPHSCEASAGDLAGADRLSTRYLQFRTQLKDPLVAWRAAVWLYSTGRGDRARAGLETTLPTAEPQLAQLARVQLARWNSPLLLGGDLAALKRTYESTPPASDGLWRILYASALFKSDQLPGTPGSAPNEELRRLLARWPLPDTAGDPALQGFMYPEFLALRAKLNP